MRHYTGLAFRLKLLALPEPWYTPIHWLHDIAYDHLSDIDLRVVMLAIRDMPYRKPMAGDSVFDCLNEWCGTCVSKHFAIYNLLRMLGLAPRLWMANYDMALCLPLHDDKLAQIAKRNKVQDVHVYVTCDFGQGDRVVDLTFPRRLDVKGFVVTQDWTLDSDCPMPYALGERRQLTPDAQGLARRRQWIQHLNPGMSSQYRRRLLNHVASIAAHTEVREENRKRYMQHTYQQLSVGQGLHHALSVASVA